MVKESMRTLKELTARDVAAIRNIAQEYAGQIPPQLIKTINFKSQQVQAAIGWIRAKGIALEDIALVDKQGDKVRQEVSAYILIYIRLLHPKLFTAPQEISVNENDNSKWVFISRLHAFITATSLKIQTLSDAYKEQQLRLLEADGHGSQHEITEEQEQEYIDIINNNLEGRLNEWVSYFKEQQDNDAYDEWFVFHCLTSIITLAEDTNGRIVVRHAKPEMLIPEVNQETIAKTYRAIKDGDTRTFRTIFKEKVEATPLIAHEHLEQTEGVWTLFEQKGNADELASLVKGSKWCTSDSATAQSQLEGGEFYVFSSIVPEDALWAGSAKGVPRIAIRMQGDEIGEIRGVGDNQNMDENILDGAPSLGEAPAMQELLQQKPELEARLPTYDKKFHDMKSLTFITGRVRKAVKNSEDGNIPLTKEEILFIRESQGQIQGFGYSRDERIAEVLGYRDEKADLMTIYDMYSEQEVAERMEDVTEQTRLYIGDITPAGVHIFQSRTSPLIIHGDTLLNNTDLDALSEGTVFNGNADFRGCTSLTEIPEGTVFNGNADFRGCTSLTEIHEGTVFNGSVYFEGCVPLTEIPEGMVFNGDAYFRDCPSLEEIPTGTVFNGHAYFGDCASLTDEMKERLKKMKAAGNILGSLLL